jgi:fermentation-respiration switch protein FrsA (DUF1100 family)
MNSDYLLKAVSLAALVFLLFVFIRYVEKKNLYFPLRTVEATPGSIGLEYEDIWVTTADGVGISGWFIRSASPRAVLIFCHGNGGNIGHRLEKVRMLNGLRIDVLVFDYRGYGESGGSPSENGLYLDAEAVYDLLVNHKKVDPRQIIAYGESLGAAVAADLVSRHDAGGIILEGSFTSVKDMAKRYFPFIPSFVLKGGFQTLEKIRSVEVPKLLFHSRDDEIVPFEFGERIFSAAPGPKEFVELRGGHNDAFLVSGDVFVERIDAFVSRF